jgi:hypothetical protein
MNDRYRARVARLTLIAVLVGVGAYFLPPQTMVGFLSRVSPFGSGCDATGFVRLAGRTDHAGVRVAADGGGETFTDEAGAFNLGIDDEVDLSASHPGFLGAATGTVTCGARELPMADLTLPGGDLNSDMGVDMLDLVAIAKTYSSCAGGEGFDPEADLNASGCVDMMDLVLVGSSYGTQGPVSWAPLPNSDGPSPVSYAETIDPLLQAKCRICHGDSGGLSVKDHASLMAGGRNGPVVVPGNPDASSLFLRVTGAVQPAMPPGGIRLDEADIAAIRLWIASGAPNS